MKVETVLTAVESERKAELVSELVLLMTDAQMDDHPREFIAEVLQSGYTYAIEDYTLHDLEQALDL